MWIHSSGKEGRVAGNQVTRLHRPAQDVRTKDSGEKTGTPRVTSLVPCGPYRDPAT